MKRILGTGLMKFSLVASITRHCLNLKHNIKKIIQGRIIKMRHQAVEVYLNAVYPKYQDGNKMEKGRLLDHAELITKRSRKQLIRRLNQMAKPKVNKGRSPGRSLELLQGSSRSPY